MQKRVATGFIRTPSESRPEIRQDRRNTVEYINPNLENAAAEEAGLVIEDLIEDVSIDGMCGVY
jgi:mycofactocin precursor